MTFWIDSVQDAGGMKYWVLFTHGKFHEPVAIISDTEMAAIAKKVLGVEHQFSDLREAIASYRKHHRITQDEFATQCGVSRNYISQIERGVAKNLSLEVYQRINRRLQQ